MIKTFTNDDLILYYYDELPKQEKAEIDYLLICDDVLHTQYQEIKKTVRLLDKVDERPGEGIVAKILQYSRGN